MMTGINYYSTCHIDPLLLDGSLDDIECDDDIDCELMMSFPSNNDVASNSSANYTPGNRLMGDSEGIYDRQSSSSDVLSRDTEISDLSDELSDEV